MRSTPTTRRSTSTASSATSPGTSTGSPAARRASSPSSAARSATCSRPSARPSTPRSRGVLEPGDWLLLGTDLVKDPHSRAAYDDSAGRDRRVQQATCCE